MARQRNPQRDKARQLWEADRTRTLKDIADELGVTSSTLRKWKSQDSWEASDKPPVTPPKRAKPKRSAPIEKERKKERQKERSVSAVEEALEEVSESGLTEKQQRFVAEYLRLFNATQAYINAYGASYNVANAEGSRLLVNPSIQAEIKRVKSAAIKESAVEITDIMAQQLKIAFSDIGNYVEFGSHEEYVMDPKTHEPKLDADGEPILVRRSFVKFKDQSQVDTSLIKRITNGKDGAIVELYDKQKAMDIIQKFLDGDNESLADQFSNMFNKLRESSE